LPANVQDKFCSESVDGGKRSSPQEFGHCCWTQPAIQEKYDPQHKRNVRATSSGGSIPCGGGSASAASCAAFFMRDVISNVNKVKATVPHALQTPSLKLFVKYWLNDPQIKNTTNGIQLPFPCTINECINENIPPGGSFEGSGAAPSSGVFSSARTTAGTRLRSANR